MEDVMVVIPARGGSKGLKGKNLKKVSGRTLLQIAVGKALAVTDNVIVSSDCPEILGEASRAGARAFTRTAGLAADDTQVVEVLRDVQAVHPAMKILLVQCTAPLMQVEDIRNALKHMDVCDMSVCCNEFHGAILDEEGLFVNRDLRQILRQDVRPQYQVAGSVWGIHAHQLAKDTLYDGIIKPFLAQHPVHLDIDHWWDWHIAGLISAPYGVALD